MKTSIQAQLQSIKDQIVTTKTENEGGGYAINQGGGYAINQGGGYAINQGGGYAINQGNNYNGKNSAYVWRIVRNSKLFNRFDVIETCTNKVQKSCLDLDTAQELVELHNQQVEKWWEVKSSQPAKQAFHTV